MRCISYYSYFFFYLLSCSVAVYAGDDYSYSNRLIQDAEEFKFECKIGMENLQRMHEIKGITEKNMKIVREDVVYLVRNLWGIQNMGLTSINNKENEDNTEEDILNAFCSSDDLKKVNILQNA